MNAAIQLPSLCSGCGICATVCPTQAIQIHWTSDCLWTAQIDDATCVLCGKCLKLCPFEPANIERWASEIMSSGGRNAGLNSAYTALLAWTTYQEGRKNSPSGGVLTELLKALYSSGEIDVVLAPRRISAPKGMAHSLIAQLDSEELLEASRGSFYEPQDFSNMLNAVCASKRRCAVVGTPCVLKAVNRLPSEKRRHVSFTIALACSHCASGSFLDCLAAQEGVRNHQPYTANLRSFDKSMDSANNFFNTVSTEAGVRAHRDRFKTAFTAMWRNWFFSMECCLYCPDFYGQHADISVKDAWGKYSNNPLGRTLLLIRNSHIAEVLEELNRTDRIRSKEVPVSDVLQSQQHTAVFKQEQALIRWKLHSGELSPAEAPKEVVREYRHLNRMRCVSHWIYRRAGAKPVGWLARALSFQKKGKPSLPQKPFHVVMTGGFGYGNVGDEAQLSQCISHWRSCLPNAKITVLSPDPDRTEREHGVAAASASRIVWFGANCTRHYIQSDRIFQFWFWWIALLVWINALRVKVRRWITNTNSGTETNRLIDRYFIRRQRRTDSLEEILADADVLHLTGGGYLTGRTSSRLWDHMLLIRVASFLNTRVVLSGQTTGPFVDPISRGLAKWGLKKAEIIEVRDRGESIQALKKLGITGPHINETFDDALFCTSADDDSVDAVLKANNIPPQSDFVVINFHHWGQSPALASQATERMAQICDDLIRRKKVTLILIPMIHADMAALRSLQLEMREPAHCLTYSYDFRIAKSVMSRAKCCITFKHHPIIFSLGSNVPALAIALDDYYLHKNAGALRLFDQDQWLLTQHSFWNERACLKLIDRFFEQLSTSRCIITERCISLKEKDGLMEEQVVLSRGAKHPVKQTAEWEAGLEILENQPTGIRLQQRIISQAVDALVCERWARLFSEDGCRKVALFWAGQHTQWMMQILKSRNLPYPCMLIDNNYQGKIHGIPTLSPEQAAKELNSLDAIVISSDANESAALEGARYVFGNKLPIITLYRERWGNVMSRYNPKQVSTQ